MASSNPAPRRWDIVVLPFPYSDQFAEKRRPALVVTTDSFNRRTGLMWVAMITSAANKGWPDDVAIPTTVKSGLPAPSVIRTVKIATIEPQRVLRITGRIDAATAKRVRRLVTAAVA